jgi:hypothetical protein
MTAPSYHTENPLRMKLQGPKTVSDLRIYDPNRKSEIRVTYVKGTVNKQHVPLYPLRVLLSLDLRARATLQPENCFCMLL